MYPSLNTRYIVIIDTWFLSCLGVPYQFILFTIVTLLAILWLFGCHYNKFPSVQNRVAYPKAKDLEPWLVGYQSGAFSGIMP